MFKLNKQKTIKWQNAIVLASGLSVVGLFIAGKTPKTHTIGTEILPQEQPAVAAHTNMAAPAPPPVLNITQLVADAQAFYNALSSTQQASLQKSYTTTLARKWSNLPCAATCRNGVQLGSLTTAQLALAHKVIADVLGTTATNGYKEYSDITLSEDALINAGANSAQYNSGLRWLGFLNAPSTTGSWMLQFGGHHYAANIAFKNGHVIGATPLFVALEPTTFTINGATYGPMEDERQGFRAMLASLSSTQLASAKLSSSFGDCLMSPGESNGNSNTFPTTKQGLAVSSLSAAQKALVTAAMFNYVSDMEQTTADAIMATYTKELDQTYIAYTGNGTSGSATSFLTSNSNYVRIDGPTVWIEFICQNGLVIQNQIHYHSVWRDHAHDYGVDLSGDAIDETTGINDFVLTTDVKIYPNPATHQITVSLPNEVAEARLSIVDLAGKTVYRRTTSGTELVVDVQALPIGAYTLTLQDGKQIYSGKFIRK